MCKLTWLGLALLGVIAGLFTPGLAGGAEPDLLRINRLLGEKFYNDYTLEDILFEDALRVDISEEELEETARIIASEFERTSRYVFDPLQSAHLYGQITIQTALWRHVADLLLAEIDHPMPTDKYFNSYPSILYEGNRNATAKGRDLVMYHNWLPHLTPERLLGEQLLLPKEWNGAEVYFKRYGVRLGKYQAAFVQGQLDARMALFRMITFFYMNEQTLKDWCETPY